MKKDKENILTKEELKRLKHEFSGDERNDLADQLASSVSTKKALEDEKSSVTSQIGSRIKEQDSIINSAAEKLRSGYEYRQAECVTEYDFEAGRVSSHRKDNNELIEDREMRPDERQMLLPAAQE